MKVNETSEKYRWKVAKNSPFAFLTCLNHFKMNKKIKLVLGNWYGIFDQNNHCRDPQWTRNLGTVNNRQTLTHYIGNIIWSVTFPGIYKNEIYNKKCLCMVPKHITKRFPFFCPCVIYYWLVHIWLETHF